MSTYETDFPGGTENINNLIYKMAAKNGRGLILLIYKGRRVEHWQIRQK